MRFFRIIKDNKDVGRGMIMEDGEGYIQMGKLIWKTIEKRKGEPWPGLYERLPEPATTDNDQPF